MVVENENSCLHRYWLRRFAAQPIIVLRSTSTESALHCQRVQLDEPQFSPRLRHGAFGSHFQFASLPSCTRCHRRAGQFGSNLLLELFRAFRRACQRRNLLSLSADKQANRFSERAYRKQRKMERSQTRLRRSLRALKTR